MPDIWGMATNKSTNQSCSIHATGYKPAQIPAQLKRVTRYTYQQASDVHHRTYIYIHHERHAGAWTLQDGYGTADACSTRISYYVSTYVLCAIARYIIM